MNKYFKWSVISISEAVLIAMAIKYEDGFIAACASFVAFIILYEWQQHVGV